MRRKDIVALFVVAAGSTILSGSIAQGAPVSFSIVSSASSISYLIAKQNQVTLTSSSNFPGGYPASSITFSMRPHNPNSTATASTSTGWTQGNSQRLSGSLAVDTDFVSSIQFLSGLGANQITGIDSGSYSPLPDGSVPGTASADIANRMWFYGGLINGGFNIDLALRDLFYGVGSGTLPLTLGGFDSDAVSLGLLAQKVAYHGRTPMPLIGPGILDEIGSGSYNTLDVVSNTSSGAGDGGLSIAATPGGYIATLTIPFNVPIIYQLQAGEVTIPIPITLSGTIVATSVVPEPATIGMLGVGVALLAPAALRRWRKRR